MIPGALPLRIASLLLLLAACGPAGVKLDDTGPSDTLVSGSIAVTPRSVDFGTLFVGQSGEAEITVRNAGSGEVDVTLQIVGSWATDYTLDAYTAQPAPGEVTSHLLRATPTDWGDHSVSVVVDDAVSGGHIEIPVGTLVQIDADGDGVGSLESGGEDCDDVDPTVHPGAEDAWYDGVDSDCAGNDDYDQDGDGVQLQEDCDDTDAGVHPGAEDAWYDGVDADCAGNDDYDQDGDGFQLEHDCDDTDANVHPGAPDPWYDGVDTDCAGNDDYDQDADGWALEDDCDDTDPTIHPEAEDAWYDGIDSDCAGNDDYDQDGDGVTIETDCNDTDPTTTGPSDEVLDGQDNDCDGTVDDVVIDDVDGGVVWGSEGYANLGDKGTLALDTDVTGDGVVDLVAGTPDVDYGALWAVPGGSLVGSSGSIAAVDVADATGPGWAWYLGNVASPAGDVDGDGQGDLVAIGSSYGGYSYGTAWFISAPSGTLDVEADAFLALTGDNDEDCMWQIAVVDLDGDGVAEVATGAPLDNNSSSYDVGNVGIFSDSDLSGERSLDDATDEIHGTSSSDYFGYRLAGGDVTGDGYADVLASAPGDDDGGGGAGAVYVLAGNGKLEWGSDADSAAWAKLTGASSGDSVGEDPLPVPGDVDGDGALDVGIPSEDEGRAWIFLGSALADASMSDATYTIAGTAGDMGSALVIDSDLDGDGADEIVVGSDGTDANGSNSGAVYLFRWSASWGDSLTADDAVARIAGAASNDYFGSGLSGGGDVNGDGLEDVVAGSVTADGSTGTDAGAIWLILGW